MVDIVTVISLITLLVINILNKYLLIIMNILIYYSNICKENEYV